MFNSVIVTITRKDKPPNDTQVKTKPTNRALEDTLRCEAWGGLRMAGSTSSGAFVSGSKGEGCLNQH